ncbi:cytidine deaminase [uncultured Ruegeria sp.]|uniref:cytidine deaminase n=1 Tax=uncultured Ruegeria sp. TaxID=259304 RepID=UPI00261DC51B|nr:cytidine deaminase [uncultured Ruegeria sp.]
MTAAETDALCEAVNHGRVSPQDWQQLLRDLNLERDEAMLKLISLASKYADPAQSGYSVGAVAQGSSGALYLGANFEFKLCPVDQTVHAEQAAVSNAFEHREAGIVRLAVSAAPCGYCRQFLYELTTARDLFILLKGKPATALTEYLPEAFGPQDLGISAALMSPDDQALEGVVPGGQRKKLDHLAIAAANRSYAPYTRAFAGAALEFDDGTRFQGSYLENAAFNPSLPPLQAALIAARFAGRDLGLVACVSIAQPEKTKVDHFRAAQSVMANISPDVAMRKIDLKPIE